MKVMDIRQYEAITSTCFVNAPVDQLFAGDLLELFIANRLQPEIGLETNALWDRDPCEFQKIADVFQEHRLTCTLHAPFFDLSPGGFDKKVVEVTREKLGRAFALIVVFQPRSIVCHLGFEENKHRHKIDRWLETALQTWQPLLAVAARSGTRVMFENTYEISPDVHRILFEQLDAPHLRFCLDTGHLMAFAHTDWQPWIRDLAPWLGQLHLHDNDGKGDAHIALGKGVFDFQGLFSYLRQERMDPLLTLEPHTPEALRQSLQYIHSTRLFDR